MANKHVPARKDDRVIVHFDYDCFYASVFEAKNPALKALPFAVQQKQIIVTCNYEARRRGLHKLQLVKDARRICPDVIIERGEDISRFRDASKELYAFIKSFSWNNKVERLGFDEIWMDVTDVVEYNVELLNRNDPEHSFFHLVRDDPSTGFSFNANVVAGRTYPPDYVDRLSLADADGLTQRLRLGSHLAMYIRHQLEQQKGYTSTAGISTTKLLSKLVGNLNKPKGQTAIMPPFVSTDQRPSNVSAFMDGHEIGTIPGIGFKLAQKLRKAVLQRPAHLDNGLTSGGTREKVTVADVRKHPEVDPQMLEKLLSSPGSPHGIGYKIWCLVNGIDDAEVSSARAVPTQISIEDSYIRLDTMPELLKELTHLARSLLTRMRIDLLGVGDECESPKDAVNEQGVPCVSHAATVSGKKWLARPKVLRLTTRARQPLPADGTTRPRSPRRTSHSAPLPHFVFGVSESIEALAEKLVREALVGMFRKLHPDHAGWNLSLINLAVTNMAETAGNSKTADGRDIGSMFRKQEDVLRDFRVTDFNAPPIPPPKEDGQDPDRDAEDGQNQDRDAEDAGRWTRRKGVGEAGNMMFDDEEETAWEDGEDEDVDECCAECGLRMPAFAMGAHGRFHLQASGARTGVADGG